MGNIPIFRGKSDCGWVIGSHCYSPSAKEHYIVEHNDEELSFLVDGDTVSQFSCFYDIHGNMIFVGDYVRDVDSFYVIRFDDDDGWMCADNGVERHFVSDLVYPVVEGNIYDNEEKQKELEDFVHTA